MQKLPVALFIAPLSLLPIAGSLLVSGCGSSADIASVAAPVANVPATGRVVLTINWPARASTRLIPDLTERVVVELKTPAGAELVPSLPLSRPSGANSLPVTFENVPLGDAEVIATAYPAEKEGKPLATGREAVRVLPGDETKRFTLRMSSTIETLTVLPVGVLPNPFFKSSAATLRAEAKNNAKEAVPLSPRKLKWESSVPAIVSVTSDGQITANNPGTAQISVRDEESGKIGLFTIIVPIKIDGPRNVSVRAKEVQYTADTGAAWSIELGSIGGDIVPNQGKFNAPGVPGKVVIIATNGGAQGRYEVTVQAGSVGGTIE